MATLKLVIGDKSYSSWSLRPWLVLKQAGFAFDEVLVRLRQPDTHKRILEHSPSGKVPVLRDGELVIWDTLAICEYLAERRPSLWPSNPAARALARSVSAEMHSGFSVLRTFMPMDVTATFGPPGLLLRRVADDVARITGIWRDCRTRFGATGPFLFGTFSIADAMYAPVVTRFVTYALELDPVSRDYVRAVSDLPAMREWVDAARRTPYLAMSHEGTAYAPPPDVPPVKVSDGIPPAAPVSRAAPLSQPALAAHAAGPAPAPHAGWEAIPAAAPRTPNDDEEQGGRTLAGDPARPSNEERASMLHAVPPAAATNAEPTGESGIFPRRRVTNDVPPRQAWPRGRAPAAAPGMADRQVNGREAIAPVDVAPVRRPSQPAKGDPSEAPRAIGDGSWPLPPEPAPPSGVQAPRGFGLFGRRRPVVQAEPVQPDDPLRRRRRPSAPFSGDPGDDETRR